jgi:hypothetical protein
MESMFAVGSEGMSEDLVWVESDEVGMWIKDCLDRRSCVFLNEGRWLMGKKKQVEK